MRSENLIIKNKKDCPFSKMAEIWFKNKKISFDTIMLHELNNNFEFDQNKPFPKIIIKNKLVLDGYHELIKQENYVLFVLNMLSEE